jgi:hypothetical protein
MLQKNKKKHFINPSIFNHSRFRAVVATAAVETFLQQAEVNQAAVDIEEGLRHTSRQPHGKM